MINKQQNDLLPVIAVYLPVNLVQFTQDLVHVRPVLQKDYQEFTQTLRNGLYPYGTEVHHVNHGNC